MIYSQLVYIELSVYFIIAIVRQSMHKNTWSFDKLNNEYYVVALGMWLIFAFEKSPSFGFFFQ